MRLHGDLVWTTGEPIPPFPALEYGLADVTTPGRRTGHRTGPIGFIQPTLGGGGSTRTRRGRQARPVRRGVRDSRGRRNPGAQRARALAAARRRGTRRRGRAA